VLGLAALACVFGMNYQPPFARSGLPFWIVVGALFAIAGGGLVVARLRKWI